MYQQRRLNADIDGSVDEFKAMLKEFKLKPKNIIFKGRGLEFEGYRDLSPDDDAVNIDWKASLRAQKLLVKKFKEERDLRIMFLVDVGSNMIFGSTEKIKCEFATGLLAAFTDLLIHSEDRVGFILFSDTITHLTDPKTGIRQFHFFMETLSDGLNYGGKSNLDQALDFATNYLDDSIFSVIIVSDFLNITKETEAKLGFLANRFETMAIQIRDPLDVTLPETEEEIVLEDPSTSRQVIINPKITKSGYEKYVSEQEKMIKRVFEKSGVPYLDLITNKSFAPPLAIFLEQQMGKF